MVSKHCKLPCSQPTWRAAALHHTKQRSPKTYLACWGDACTLDALLEGPSENSQALRAQHGRVPLAITAFLALGCRWWLRFSTDFALLPRRVRLVHFVIELNAVQEKLLTERKDPHEVSYPCTSF